MRYFHPWARFCRTTLLVLMVLWMFYLSCSFPLDQPPRRLGPIGTVLSRLSLTSETLGNCEAGWSVYSGLLLSTPRCSWCSHTGSIGMAGNSIGHISRGASVLPPCGPGSPSGILLRRVPAMRYKRCIGVLSSPTAPSPLTDGFFSRRSSRSFYLPLRGRRGCQKHV